MIGARFSGVQRDASKRTDVRFFTCPEERLKTGRKQNVSQTSINASQNFISADENYSIDLWVAYSCRYRTSQGCGAQTPGLAYLSCQRMRLRRALTGERAHAMRTQESTEHGSLSSIQPGHRIRHVNSQPNLAEVRQRSYHSHAHGTANNAAAGSLMMFSISFRARCRMAATIGMLAGGLPQKAGQLALTRWLRDSRARIAYRG